MEILPCNCSVVGCFLVAAIVGASSRSVVVVSVVVIVHVAVVLVAIVVIPVIVVAPIITAVVVPIVMPVVVIVMPPWSRHRHPVPDDWLFPDCDWLDKDLLILIEATFPRAIQHDQSGQRGIETVITSLYLHIPIHLHRHLYQWSFYKH